MSIQLITFNPLTVLLLHTGVTFLRSITHIKKSRILKHLGYLLLILQNWEYMKKKRSIIHTRISQRVYVQFEAGGSDIDTVVFVVNTSNWFYKQSYNGEIPVWSI